MMKKGSLKDIKKQNKLLILHLLIHQPGISRSALAEKSQLSPATVSTLVSEMLEEGILSETGEEKSTGGRRRVCLTFNAAYAVIPVFEISRSSVTLSVFDMQLRLLSTSTICDGLTDGNTLFCKICEAVCDCTASKGTPRRALGIGLAFQDDLNDKDFSVMYSTSLSSETIPLETALSSQLRIPVISDFFGHLIPQAEKIPQIFGEDSTSEDYAWIHIGEKAWASVVVGGKLISMMGRDTFDLSPLLEQPRELPWQKLLTESAEEQDKIAEEWEQILTRMAQALFSLFVFFPVKRFFLEGTCFQHTGFLEEFRNVWAERFAGENVPELCPIGEDAHRSCKSILAAEVRAKSLLTC